MEIGFGMGETTVNIAQRFPDTGFIAVDVHQPGIGKLLSLIEETGLNNVRVMDEDALKILRAMVPNNGLDAIHLFFPDPWPKTRHHKRRIVNSEFLKIIAEKLKVGGSVHLATDWEPYARWMEQEFSKSSSFKGGVVERPEWRPITRFEAQGLRKDHKVTDLMYEKI
jgi:tRNA (guanine-N7-)-methyltransferase